MRELTEWTMDELVMATILTEKHQFLTHEEREAELAYYHQEIDRRLNGEPGGEVDELA